MSIFERISKGGFVSFGESLVSKPLDTAGLSKQTQEIIFKAVPRPTTSSGFSFTDKVIVAVMVTIVSSVIIKELIK